MVSIFVIIILNKGVLGTVPLLGTVLTYKEVNKRYSVMKNVIVIDNSSKKLYDIVIKTAIG